MRLACVLVHYHTPELLARAVGGLRRELEEAVGADFDLIVVDNGSDAQSIDQLRSLPARVLEAPTNLGYAGGLDYGLRRCEGADFLLVGNPDLDLRGCVAPLIDQLTEVGVAGPRFYWDEQLRFVMPPSDPTDRRFALAAARAGASGEGARKARARFRSHARRHWQATQPVPSHSLSGALLAFRAEAWRRVGPFDEGFRLYFEETDWLERARRLGVEGRYVPSARVLHQHAVSTSSHPEAKDWFEQSALRFRLRHFGRRFTRRLERASREQAVGRLEPSESIPELPRPLDLSPWLGSTHGSSGLWIEVSPTRVGFPSVGELLEPTPAGSHGAWTFPESLLTGLGADSALVYLTDDAGRELAVWRLSLSVGA